MRRDQFYFDLPDELIAREPAAERTGSRLLYLDSTAQRLEHSQFTSRSGGRTRLSRSPEAENVGRDT